MNIETDIAADTGAHVLITGGSGLAGRYLTSALLSAGYRVSHLSMRENRFGRVRVHRWSPEMGILDAEALKGTDFIIHLAGANIGEKRWTKKRKKEIIASRVDSANLLYKVVSENGINIRAFISASASGYYGLKSSEQIFTEDDPPGSDFLAETCILWEKAAMQFSEAGIRTVVVRTAVILDKKNSALGRLLAPAGWGIYPVLGSGRQYMPWIHIEDLCRIYLKAVQDETMSGAYNAAAPEHITNRQLMVALARAMGRRGLCMPVPGLLLKAALGEMAGVVLKGSRITPAKILSSGHEFSYPGIAEALEEVLSPS